MEIVEISCLRKLPRSLSVTEIRSVTKKILKGVTDCKSYEISIIVTDDLMIQKLNKAKRKKNKPTDVLSFPVSEKDIFLPHRILGEVVISIETAVVQAEKIGHSLKEEFYRLLVHGILHLLGYDHEKNDFHARQMRKKEDECLAIIFGD